MASLKLYEKQVDPKYKTCIDFKKIHTWDDVLKEVDEAARHYDRGSNIWTRIRKGFRRFGNSSQAFNAWLTVLPSQSQYVSILCAGFKLILGVRARREQEI